ncbi:hypothetical protein [Singulisphaera sp. PoT]|uniref:tetratricopeptide repeat protein n=1 Tax=Singulisphaera sp. PoT TaxID=3411797 RepID=UPI003BF5B95D
MSDPNPDDQDVDERIETLFEAISQAHDRCEYRTCARLATEVKRLAKAERKLSPYLRALYMLTINATDLLDLDQGREAAIELIALLESEDRARMIQPDYKEEEYAYSIERMSSCAYDNLATITAVANGYNSEGAHGAIGEGIQICHKTGKLECIVCFRDYGTDVYRASDDLELAMHHARQISSHGDTGRGIDRRWVGADNEANFLMLGGDLDAAEAAATSALAFSASSPNPLRSRLQSSHTLNTIRLLKTGVVPSQEPTPGEIASSYPAVGEFPLGELREALRRAMEASVVGDQEAAIRILSDWDRRLTRDQCLEHWFEVRLRLIAAYYLAGLEAKVPALARQLETKAKEARDWLTLRRLARLQDPNEAVTPIAALLPMSVGPFASAAPSKQADALEAATEPDPDDEAGDGSEADAPPAEPRPVEERLMAVWGRFREAQADAELRPGLFDMLLVIEPASATEAVDALRLLHLANILPFEDASRAEEVWAWAEALAARFPREATVLSLLADLGDTLLDLPESPLADRITPDRIEGLFRQSLDLDPEDSGNFARAGAYSLKTQDLGEAERRFARGFRLDRANAFITLRLASIYQQTDRARDALSVLDMCLRNDCESAQVAWEAALLASGLNQFEVMLTYLDKYESLEPGEGWVNYYRARGLLELGRPQEAIVAIEEERRRQPEVVFPVAVFLANAEAALGNADEFRKRLGEVLELRLKEVTYLTRNGINSLFESLWKASEILPADDPKRAELESILLSSGLAPSGLFEPARMANPKKPGVGFYRCQVIQPLDATWPDSPGCLAGEVEWKAYSTTWGVLASDEGEASQVALEWQSRCYAGPAFVESCTLDEEGFTDHPGVVWQSYRNEAETPE